MANGKHLEAVGQFQGEVKQFGEQAVVERKFVLERAKEKGINYDRYIIAKGQYTTFEILRYSLMMLDAAFSHAYESDGTDKEAIDALGELTVGICDLIEKSFEALAVGGADLNRLAKAYVEFMKSRNKSPFTANRKSREMLRAIKKMTPKMERQCEIAQREKRTILEGEAV